MEGRVTEHECIQTKVAASLSRFCASRTVLREPKVSSVYADIRESEIMSD